MGFLTKAQILTRHVQVSGLLSKLNIPLPKVYFTVISFSDLFNMNWSFFSIVVPDLPLITFQIEFIAGCVVLPLAVMLMTLVAFLDYFYLVWFLSLTIGVLMLLASLTRYISGVPIAGELSEMLSIADGFSGGNINYLSDDAGLWVITAVVLLAVSLQSIACRLLVPRYLKNCAEPSTLKILEKGYSLTLEPVALTCAMVIAGVPMEVVYTVMSIAAVYFLLLLWPVLNGTAATSASSLSAVGGGVGASQHDSFRAQFGLIALLVVGGVICMCAFVPIDPPAEVRSTMRPFGYLLAFAAFMGTLLHVLEISSARFLKMRGKLQAFSDRGFLTACFFFICAAMVPVVTNCLQVFMCVTYTCPMGTRFNPFVSMAAESGDGVDALSGVGSGDSVSVGIAAQDRYCDPCAFEHSPFAAVNASLYTNDGYGGGVVERNVCPFSSDDLCPSWSDMRLLQHPDTPCGASAGSAYTMLVFAAVVSLVVFGVVINVMFFKLTRDITRSLVASTESRWVALRRAHQELRSAYSDREFIETAKKFANEAREQKKHHAQHGAKSSSPAGAEAHSGHGNNHHHHNAKGVGVVDDLELVDIVPPTTAGGDGASSYSRRLGRKHRANSKERLLLGDTTDEDAEEVVPLCETGGGLKGCDAAGVLAVPMLSANSSPSCSPTSGSSALITAAGGYDVNMFRVAAELSEAPSERPPSYDDAFADVCARITPKASSLYSPYRFPMRYFLLVDNFHRLVLVFASVVLARLDGVGAIVNACAHAAMLLFLFVACPYHDKWEHMLSVISAICDTVNSVYVVLLYALPDERALRSDAVAMTFVVIGFAIPFLAAIVLFGIGTYTSWHNPYLKAEKEKMKAEKRARKEAAAKKRKALETEIAFQKELKRDNDRRSSGVTALAEIEQLRRTTEALEKVEEDPNAVKTSEIDNTTKRTMLTFFLGGAVPWLGCAAVLSVIAVIKGTTPSTPYMSSASTAASLLGNLTASGGGGFTIGGITVGSGGGGGDAATSGGSAFTLGSDAYHRDQRYVLGGRFDWEDFTQHCCCFTSRVPMTGYTVTERWVCANLPLPYYRMLLVANQSNSNVSSSPFANASSSPFNYTRQLEQMRLTNGSAQSLFRSWGGGEGGGAVYRVAPTVTITKNRKVAVGSGIVRRMDSDDGLPLRSVCGNRLRYPHNCTIVLDNTVVVATGTASGNQTGNTTDSGNNSAASHNVSYYSVAALDGKEYVRLVCDPDDFLADGSGTVPDKGDAVTESALKVLW